MSIVHGGASLYAEGSDGDWHMIGVALEPIEVEPVVVAGDGDAVGSVTWRRFKLFQGGDVEVTLLVDAAAMTPYLWSLLGFACRPPDEHTAPAGDILDEIDDALTDWRDAATWTADGSHEHDPPAWTTGRDAAVDLGEGPMPPSLSRALAGMTQEERRHAALEPLRRWTETVEAARTR